MNTIEIKNLNKKIKGAEVLKDINLHLEGGKVYGLKGKNGSGKTMLMRAVCGLILPTGGSITINGEQLGKQISFPRSVGILIENPSFIPGYTGLKNLSVLAAIQKRVGEDEIRETLEKIGLDPDALDESGAKQVRTILKEQKERGAVCIIACHDSEELNFLSDEIIEIAEGRIVPQASQSCH